MSESLGRLVGVIILVGAGWQAYLGADSDEENRVQRAEPQQAVRAVVVDPRLRSAFLLRAIEEAGGSSRYARSSASADEQLAAHFEAVDEILTRHTERSLNLAVARYETAHEVTLADDEREALRAQLERRRTLQLERLRAYGARGRFPQNEGVAEGAVPIFVDGHDTACAVGHLMRCAGAASDVEAISGTNNLVYVTDVANGPVVEWVLESGLLLEEAALVQPAYPGDCPLVTPGNPRSLFFSDFGQTFALTATVNPFGTPATGTGVLIQADLLGADEPVTLQQTSFTSLGMVNIDAPVTAGGGFLIDAPRVQRANEAPLASFFDAGATHDFVADDSYWGSEITTVLLGGGFDGSGDPGDNEMRLVGGTDFGQTFEEFDVIYVVTDTERVEFEGEMAIGASALIPFAGCFRISPVPEPATAGSMLFGVAMLSFSGRRRRGR